MPNNKDLSLKEYGISNEVLRSQTITGFHGVTPDKADKIWVAYEPVWAIGVNGKPASVEYAAEKHSVIRKCLIELFGEESGNKIPVLYGGSVNPNNADDLIERPEIDGLFTGRSAWQAEAFNKLIRSALNRLGKKA